MMVLFVNRQQRPVVLQWRRSVQQYHLIHHYSILYGSCYAYIG